MAFSDTYWHFLFFFYPSVVVCKSNTLQGKTFKKTLELDFVSTVLTEHKSQLVNCKNCVDRCRTIKRRACLLGGIQDWIVYLKTWLRYLE